ncbi:ABC transporter substrate-binding protein (plasmid) [Mesorhizobium sp. ORM8.1]
MKKHPILSRRLLLGSMASVGILGGLGLPLSKARASTPKQGGSVRFAMAEGSTENSLDPRQIRDVFQGVSYAGSVCNTLTEILPDGSVVGDLAESFASQDNKNWIFHIRQGVTFHDGRKLTSHDVVASLKHHIGPDVATDGKPIVDQIADLSADGDYVVKITLKGPNSDYPYMLAAWMLVIMPAAPDGSLDWQKGIGTGPFSIVKFDPGVSLKLKKNPNYHKPGKPYFDELEWLVIADVGARTNALMSGDIQWMYEVDQKTINLLKKNPNVALQNIPGPRHYIFLMDVTQAPFDDNNVRLAMKYAIDREGIVKKLYGEYARPGNDTPVAPLLKFAADPKPRHTFDAAKAREYLKAAGHDKLSVNLSVADVAFPGCVESALLYKESAAEAGIDINVVREPNDAFWSSVYMHRPFFAAEWGGRPNIDWTLTVELAAESSTNEARWKNPRFNELLVGARAEKDEAKRAAMYAEAQQLSSDDGGMITLAFADYVNAASTTIGHDKIGGHLHCDDYRMAERWWLESA